MTVKTVPMPLLHRLYYLFTGVKRRDALNQGEKASTVSDDVAFELRQSMNAMKLDAIDRDTGAVDYQKLANSAAYANYRKTTYKLKSFSLAVLRNHDERLAFWINLYNAMVVDAVVCYGVEHSVREVRGFFAKSAYIIDGYRFSADDVEHGILRANAGHPAIPGRQFSVRDPRTAFVVAQLDPRIHLTLVCASESCPPIGVYNADRIDEQLNAAAYNFINGGEVQVDLEANVVTLSKIFQWYAPDFGGSAINQIGWGSFVPILRFVAQYHADDEIKAALSNEPERFKVKFSHYNWGLNLLS